MLPALAVEPATAFLLLLASSFVVPVLFAVSLRNVERSRREPWRAVASAFAWGGTGAVVAALAVELLLQEPFKGFDPWLGVVPLATVVLAPVAEELAKAAGLFFVPDLDPEPEDGLIYGGAAGLGFAATENVLYVGATFLLEGHDVALATALYRGIVTVSLHAAASAIAGYGIWRSRHFGRDGAAVGGIAAAMLVHALYNGTLVLGTAAGALLAGTAGVLLFVAVRRRVRALDRAGEAIQGWPPLPPP